MDIRRTLEKQNPSRELKPRELKVGFCVSLSDTDKNIDVLFVAEISATEIVFENRSAIHPTYQTILTREGETLRDEKGRTVMAWGKPIQYDMDGGEIQ